MYIGITAEWNPFHQGHEKLIKTLKTDFPDAPVVCAMSGAFVQRGEPAVFEKSLKNGTAPSGQSVPALIWPWSFLRSASYKALIVLRNSARSCCPISAVRTWRSERSLCLLPIFIKSPTGRCPLPFPAISTRF